MFGAPKKPMSGMMQMMVDMLGINPEEIVQQALQFKAVADSINDRLEIIQRQNAAIMAALKIEVSNGENIADDKPGNADAGTPGLHGPESAGSDSAAVPVAAP